MTVQESRPLPPTQIWIGSPSGLLEHVYSYLEQQFEASDIVCAQIRDHQHHAVRWLRPEKNQYRRIDLEPLFTELAFALAPGQKFFFILEYADLLTPACANSLLKSLEEPPAGYHFILLVERRELVLPTIMSRALIREFATAFSEDEFESFLQLFKAPDRANQVAMAKAFDQAKFNEYQTRILVDKLYIYWSDQYKTFVQVADISKRRRAEKMMRIIAYAYERLPMPGSTKMFWRNLFLLMTV